MYHYIAIGTAILGSAPLLSSGFVGIGLTYPLLGVTLGALSLGIGINIYLLSRLKEEGENSKHATLFKVLPVVLSFGIITACVLAGAAILYTTPSMSTYCLSALLLESTGLASNTLSFGAQVALADVTCLIAGGVLAAIIAGIDMHANELYQF